MNLYLTSGLLVLLAYYVGGEPCMHDDDCTLTVCGLQLRVDCWHRDDRKRDSDRPGECTCVHTKDDGGSGVTCTNPTDCVQSYAPCTHNDHQWHCIDTRCRCNF